MPEARFLINHFRNLIVNDATLASFGIIKDRIYRQYLANVKDPVYPAISIVTDSDPEIFAPIEDVKIWITVHSKTFIETEQIIEALQSLLHNYKGHDANINIYLSISKGTYEVPEYDEKINAWTSTLMFFTKIG